MSSAAPTFPSRPVTWETFAITDVRWLVAAFAWSFALLAALAWMRWLFVGYPMVLGLSLIAAVITAPLLGESAQPLDAPTVVRYALVDAVFVAFTLHPLFALVQAMVSAASGTYTGGILYGLLPPLLFVPGFYASLGVIGHFRVKSGTARHAPVIAALVVAVAFAPSAYRRYADHAADQRSREAGIATYEKSTGRKVTPTDRLALGNSLHGFDHRVNALAIDREERLLVAGGFTYYAGQDARGFVRLLPDGRLDASFAAKVTGDPVNSAPTFLLVAPDGSIVANGGLAGTTPQALDIARLKPDGTRDDRFQPTVERAPGQRESIEARDLQPDGGLVFAAPANFLSRPDQPCVQRINPDGTHDTAFESAALAALFGPVETRGKNLNCNVSTLTALASGKLLLQGAFPATDHRFGLLRLNADGTRDDAYRPELGTLQASRTTVGPGGEFYALAQDPVPGSSPPAFRLQCVRLDAEGRMDRSFTFSPGNIRLVDRLAVQPDGKLLVVGTTGTGTSSVVRLLADGRPDPAFRGALVEGFVTTLLLQPDGRIVLGGEFVGVSGAGGGGRLVRLNIARLEADGSPDGSFDPR